MGRISSPASIDRVESRTLDEALERATWGETPTVLVGGESGIGKARLVSDFSSNGRPLALVLEALHWSDRSTLEAAAMAERLDLLQAVETPA